MESFRISLLEPSSLVEIYLFFYLFTLYTKYATSFERNSLGFHLNGIAFRYGEVVGYIKHTIYYIVITMQLRPNIL